MMLRNNRKRIVLVCLIWMSSTFAWTQNQLFTERLKLDDRDPLESARLPEVTAALWRWPLSQVALREPPIWFPLISLLA